MQLRFTFSLNRILRQRIQLYHAHYNNAQFKTLIVVYALNSYFSGCQGLALRVIFGFHDLDIRIYGLCGGSRLFNVICRVSAHCSHEAHESKGRTHRSAAPTVQYSTYLLF